jgi:hypothetical protein
MESTLIIDGRPIALDARFALRWVDCPGQPPQPVLYRDGKRVVGHVILSLQFEQAADPHGGNANTN